MAENDDWTNKRKRRRWFLIGIYILSMLAIIAALLGYEVCLRKKIERMTPMTTTPPSTAVPAPKLAITNAVSVLAVIKPGSGKGVEHAFIRQLMKDPEAFGYKGLNEKVAVKKWADREAHRLAIRFGFIG